MHRLTGSVARLAFCCLAACTALLADAAQPAAQELPPVNIQQFRLAPGPADYLTIYGTGLTPHLNWTAGFFVNFADAPLRQPGASSIDTEVVDFQLTGDIIGTIGLWDRAELGIAAPVTFLQSSDDLTPVAGNAFTGDLTSLALGDLRLSPKFEILNLLDGFGLSAITVLYLPTGDSEAFNGDGNFSAEGRLAGDMMVYKGIRAGANLGFRFRPEGREIREAFVGNEVLWGAGVVIPLFTETMDAMFEINGAIPAGSGSRDEVSSEAVPAEAMIAVRYAIDERWTLTVGGGLRISDGYGSPNSRVFVGIGNQWVTGGQWHWDYDNDGFIGLRDQCPRETEDLDGYLDTDGCPDPDNDGDGILDSEDACPEAGGDDVAVVGPDGCPDNDTDGDGIVNERDKCPEDPEDMDRFEDSDGCPDIDNDGDGILDTTDSCPDSPETLNGLVDEDGCPEVEGQAVIVTKNKIEILQQVYFDTGKATIKEESFVVLDAIVDVMRRNPEIQLLQIQGHTDDRGNDNNNMRLSQRRAAAVLDYIVENGIDAERLTSVGYGETEPIDTNDTREGRTRNRRVEFVILERGKSSTKIKRGGSGEVPFDELGDDPF